MRVFRFILFPFSILYNCITSIRNKLFDLGVLKSTSFVIPVIAVGNLNVGGTGKTPQIEYLIRLLQDTYKTAVLSRGYKRKTKGFQIVNQNNSAEDVGDEPLQFFKKFENITVAVDADRTNGINQLMNQELSPEIVLLDDAYQHRKVTAGYYVLLTKYNDLFSDDYLLPTGNLREARRGAKRAHAIIVTKCPKELSKEEQQQIIVKLNVLPNQKLFFTAIEYNEELKGKKKLHITDLKTKEVVLVTGIANPNPLLNYLKSKEISFLHLKYPDHHHFSKEDIAKINTVSNDVGSKEKLILTTEKDYVRLVDQITNINYIEIKSVFLNNEALFVSEIQDFVKG